MEPIIQIKNVTKTFIGKDNQVEALKGISLDINKGDIYGIIGMSGAGKSTLVRCLNYLEKPTTGTVVVEDQDLSTLTEAELRKVRTGIAMIFQHFNLLMQRSVLDNVCFPMEIVGVKKQAARKRAMELLEIVGLKEKADAYPSQLSGGQKQRVAIARALINRPKVLLLDEPLGALDLKLRKQMQIELKRLQRKLGITFVYVTHDQEEALTMSDRIAIINQGVLEQVDTAFDIYEHPKTRFVAGFIGESNIFDAVVISQDGDTVTVGTEVGKAQASGFTGELAAGSAVSVSVRPENMLYSRERVEGFHIKGVVKEHIYVGNLIKTIVLLNDGTEVKINRFSMDDLPKEGEMIYLYWHLEKGIVLPEKNLVDTDASRDIEGGDEDEEE